MLEEEVRALRYYMSLHYEMKIEEVPEEEGGGFMISIPDLGEWSVCAWGETLEEAYQILQEVKKEAFQRWLEMGIPIPEPKVKKQDLSFKKKPLSAKAPAGST